MLRVRLVTVVNTLEAVAVVILAADGCDDGPLSVCSKHQVSRLRGGATEADVHSIDVLVYLLTGNGELEASYRDTAG